MNDGVALYSSAHPEKVCHICHGRGVVAGGERGEVDEPCPECQKDLNEDALETCIVELSEAQVIAAALRVALRYGGVDGEHHKAWVIDQMVRKLTGVKYEGWVRAACNGEDGPDTYEWDVGIAP